MSDLSIVVAAAGVARRMRSYGARALLPLPDGRTLIRRQVDVLRAACPGADLVVVVGHEADRVMRALPRGVRVVENEHHETTGPARSVVLGLRAAAADRALVVYGDLVFDREAVEGLAGGPSAVLVRPADPGGPAEVGVTVDPDTGLVVHFEYGLPLRWLQMALLAGAELRYFREAGGHKDRRRHLGHEVLNAVIERGGELRAVARPAAQVVEIDAAGDVRKVPR